MVLYLLNKPMMREEPSVPNGNNVLAYQSFICRHCINKQISVLQIKCHASTVFCKTFLSPSLFSPLYLFLHLSSSFICVSSCLFVFLPKIVCVKCVVRSGMLEPLVCCISLFCGICSLVHYNRDKY